jgi:predicted esterase
MRKGIARLPRGRKQRRQVRDNPSYAGVRGRIERSVRQLTARERAIDDAGSAARAARGNVASIVCEEHGLRFDPAVQTGCPRCRPAPKRTSRRWAVVGAAAALAAAGAAIFASRRAAPPTEAPKPGGTVAPLDYAGGRAGHLFVPASAEAGPRPLILLLDPAGRSEAIVGRYALAAEKRGWLAASSSHVRNGTSDEADAAELVALLERVRAEHAVDPERIFAGGFSGGACGAYRLAIVRADLLSGAIVECGHMGSFREVGERVEATSRFYLFTRSQDFNRAATRTLHAELRRKGCRVDLAERPGGHEPMRPNELEAGGARLAGIRVLKSPRGIIAAAGATSSGSRRGGAESPARVRIHHSIAGLTPSGRRGLCRVGRAGHSGT